MFNLDFINKVLTKSFYSKMKESIVSFNENEKIKINAYKEINQRIFQILSSQEYNPSPPRDYLFMNKGSGVARVIPVFEVIDYGVYYLCVKSLEEHIAINRIRYTFGGWRIGNPIKKKEESDLDEIEYNYGNTFNNWNWKKNWKEFQQIMLTFSESGRYKYCVKFDIANFYDSVNLHRLKSGILSVADKQLSGKIELLFFFLFAWNRRYLNYKSQDVGLPQDEFGECSRLLSNFYLQEFDQSMYSFCTKNRFIYLRYADDLVVFYNNVNDVQKILLFASIELYKIGLNLNSSKVIVFKSPSEVREYWCKNEFIKLDPPSKINITRVISRMRFLESRGKKFRKDSLIKRLLSIDLIHFTANSKLLLKEEINSIDVINSLPLHYLKKAEKFIPRSELKIIMKKASRKYPHNMFHYTHLQYLRFIGLKGNNPEILNAQNKIRRIKKFMLVGAS